MAGSQEDRIEKILASKGFHKVSEAAEAAPDPRLRALGAAADVAGRVAEHKQEKQMENDLRREQIDLQRQQVEAARAQADAERQQAETSEETKDGLLKRSSDAAKSGAQKAAKFYNTVTRPVSPIFTLLVVILVLGVHIWDAYTGFVGLFNFYFMVYALLGILVGFTVWIHSGTAFLNLLRYMLRWGVIALVTGFLIPRVVKYSFGFIDNLYYQDVVLFLLSFFPFFLLTIIYSPDEFQFTSGVRKLANFWIGGWLIILLISLIGGFVLPQVDSYDASDTGTAIRNVWNRLWDNLSQIPDRIVSGINRTQQLINPNYYVGQVENNKESINIGVRLEDIEPIDPFFPQNTAPIVRGYIVANGFLDEKANVAPVCTTTAGETALGIPDEPTYEVFYGSDEYFECTFPQGLPPRNYPVAVSASFDFETWAYLPYEFVFDEKIRDYARLQQDIYRELDITREPIAVYTDGPVQLGMGGSRNPIPVHLEEPHLRNAKIGFSIQSRWPRGELQSVTELVMSIPKEFSIGECNRPGIVEGPIPDENVLDAAGNALYEQYIFKNAEGPVVAFTGITCDLLHEDLDALPELIGNDKATRTFVALAKYRYMTTETTMMRVTE